MADLVRSTTIDEILDANVELARGEVTAWEGYRSHAHRVNNFALAVAGPLPVDDQEKLAIAAAFHDIHVFDGLDYLEPSIESAAAYLRETGREDWDREVSLTIAHHHKVLPYLGEHARLVEPFRRADWNDFTLGIRRSGIPKEIRSAANEEFPVSEFAPKAVTRFALHWARHHPLRPAPPFRGEAALRRTGR